MKYMYLSDVLLTDLQNGIYRKGMNFGIGVSIVRMVDLYRMDEIITDNLDKLESNETEIKKFGLAEGDILINRTSLKKEGIGKCSIITNIKESVLYDCSIIRIRIKKNIIVPKYLFYFLNSQIGKLQIISLSKTATITTIAQPQVKKIKIPVPPLSVQNKIVSILERAEKLKEKRGQANKETGEIIQSVFYEMFGDPVKNEKKFKKVKLHEVCEINPKKSEIALLDDNLIVSFIEMASVSNTGEINTKEEKIITDVKKSYTYFRENDVLFAKITPCMENGKGTIAKNLKNKIGFGSTEFHILRPLSRCNSIWLFTLTKLQQFRKTAEEHMTGTAGQKRVPKIFLQNFEVALPPLSLQDKFASFVKRIEDIKEKQKQSAKDINTLFDALLQKAFNGQLVAE